MFDIALEKIHYPDNLRDYKIMSLANHIKTHGLKNPIIVVREGDGYRIIDGGRRYLAHKIIGAESIKCVLVS